MAEELDSTIRENAAGPESASADGVHLPTPRLRRAGVKQHNLRDQTRLRQACGGQVEADKPAYLR